MALDDTKGIIKVGGRGGGGKLGGGNQTPVEADDNLFTDSTLYVLDLVSEGEIEGWSDAVNPAKCIFFDGVPLQNPDDSFNFEGVEYWLRTGTPDQDPIPGFAAVENEVTAGLGGKVTTSQPITYQLTDPDVDAVRVKVGTPALQSIADNGDINETSVQYRVMMQVGAGPFTEQLTRSFTGKTTSGYQRQHRIEVPTARPINIRVERITADSESTKLQNDIYFTSITEVIDAKLSYPNSAIVGMAIPATTFGGSVPRRTYLLKGMKCWVPSNYDPVARTYDEGSPWDGTFVKAFTSNPAFFGYTVYIEDRWGLGDRVAPELVDKWSVYEIGKYCDRQVDDGLGGTEPLLTINGVINERQAAYDVITQLSSTWRGATYWGAGAVVPVQDRPADPVKLVTNANVIDGAFTYQSSALDARKTAAVATFRHANDHYRMKPGAVHEDHAAIDRFGRRQLDIQLPFCTSVGEALRTVRWHIDTNLNEVETVTYTAGMDHIGIRPFDIVLIADKYKILKRTMGRVKAILPARDVVEVDAPIGVVNGTSYTLHITKTDGTIHEVGVNVTVTEDASQLSLAAALPSDVEVNTPFILASADAEPLPYRVLMVEPKGHEVTVTALRYDAGKEARVEGGLYAYVNDPIVLPEQSQPIAPASVSVEPIVRPDPGSVSKLHFLVSWPNHPDTRVVRHLVRVREPGSGWRWADESDTNFVEYAARTRTQGTYDFRCYAVGLDGQVSGFVTQSYTHVLDDFVLPETPVISGYEAGYDTITLRMAEHPASDFAFFKIYGATAVDPPTLVHLDSTPSNTYTRRPPDGDQYVRYKVTAVTRAPRESDPADASFVIVAPTGVGLDALGQDVLDHVDAARAAAIAQAAADRAEARLDTLEMRHAELINSLAAGNLQAQLRQHSQFEQNSAAITEEIATRASGDEALAASIATLTATVGQNTAGLAAELIVRADADSALSTSLTSVTTTVDGHTATIADHTASIDGTVALGGWSINNNGVAAFLGIISEHIDGNVTSSVPIQADQFSISAPDGTSSGIPFTVVTTEYTNNGETVPVGTYMTEAFIRNGSITNAMIGNAAITSAKIGDAEITSAKIADAAITSAKIGDAEISNAKIANGSITNAKISGTLQSSTFISGSSGWQLKQNGDAEVNNLVVRADMIEADAVVETKTGSTTGTSTASNNSQIVTTATLSVATGGLVMISASTDIRGNDDTDLDFYVDVRRGSTVIATSEVKNPGQDGGTPLWGGVTLTAFDQPSGGSYSYNLRFRWSKTTTTGTSPQVKNRKIAAVDFKPTG